MARNTFYSVKQTQGEQDPPNFDSVFTERFLLPREVKKTCGIRHFRKTGMGRLRHLRRLRRFSPTYSERYDKGHWIFKTNNDWVGVKPNAWYFYVNAALPTDLGIRAQRRHC